MSVMALIMATGFLAKRIKIFNEASDKTFSEFIVYITCPAMILISLSEPKDYLALENLFAFICLSALTILFSYFASKQYLKLFKYSEKDSAVYRLGMIFGNTAYIGFPLCYSLFGSTGLLYASIYSAIQEAFLWSIGIDIISKKTNAGLKKLKNLLNPNMIAIILGFILLSGNVVLPDLLHNTLSLIGSITIPLAYMMVGSGFYKTKIDVNDIKGIFLPTLYKLILIPIIVGTVLYFVNIDPMMKTVLLLQIAMPFAASGVTLSKSFGQDNVLASKAVTITTGACLITLPVIVFFADRFF